MYTLAKVWTVPDLWQEWKVGLGGATPVEQLEQRWGARWRPSGAQKTAFCRRKVILDEINRLVDLGQTPDQAVAQLEALRAGKSLRRLSEVLQAQNGAQEKD